MEILFTQVFYRKVAYIPHTRHTQATMVYFSFGTIIPNICRYLISSHTVGYLIYSGIFPHHVTARSCEG